MRLVPIAERLKEAGFKRVQGVLELISLKAPPPVLPAYYVVPDTETAQPNSLTGGAHRQKTAQGFGVVIMMEGAGANRDRTSEALSDEEEKVIQALLGWVHPDAGGLGCDYAGARLLSVSGSTLSWMVSFRTGRMVRKVN